MPLSDTASPQFVRFSLVVTLGGEPIDEPPGCAPRRIGPERGHAPSLSIEPRSRLWTT